MKVKILNSIHKIPQNTFISLSNVSLSADQKEALDYPFLKYEFLSALEASGSVSPERGWQPHHLALVHEENGHEEKIIAFMPNYIKAHSWGEYVFDQEWAYVFKQLGETYYPKYLTAVPFSPIMGPRWLVSEDYDALFCLNTLLGTLKENLQENNISSWHCLFPHKKTDEDLESSELPLKLLRRSGCQFRWKNRNYQCFDDFLSNLKSKNRKNIRRERKKINEQGLHLKRILGPEISETDWELFFIFYANTYQKRGHTPHLNLNFFLRIGKEIPTHLHIEWAFHQDQPVGAALFFKDNQTLYGRYWGCNQEFDALHFETCFYRGIEYCIENKLKSFDSGAQGEHKILRGFEPVETASYHWIKDAKINQLVSSFLIQEKKQILAYSEQASRLLPYKQLS